MAIGNQDGYGGELDEVEEGERRAAPKAKLYGHPSSAHDFAAEEPGATVDAEVPEGPQGD